MRVDVNVMLLVFELIKIVVVVVTVIHFQYPLVCRDRCTNEVTLYNSCAPLDLAIPIRFYWEYPQGSCVVPI